MMALFFLKDPFFQTLQDFSLVFAWFQPINFITAILYLKPTKITYVYYLPIFQLVNCHFMAKTSPPKKGQKAPKRSQVQKTGQIVNKRNTKQRLLS